MSNQLKSPIKRWFNLYNEDGTYFVFNLLNFIPRTQKYAFEVTLHAPPRIERMVCIIPARGKGKGWRTVTEYFKKMYRNKFNV